MSDVDIIARIKEAEKAAESEIEAERRKGEAHIKEITERHRSEVEDLRKTLESAFQERYTAELSRMHEYREKVVGEANRKASLLVLDIKASAAGKFVSELIDGLFGD
ncbi:MAG: hypothetical protein M1454_00250 [Candidatus Thermoplasmatota archaeon]|nr:hypothetical protein [Candidatus Thermoplasmatota archaeon]MCL5731076.1 hypothetical protein [Candidatus Thermoplasmatota archaeon]